MGKKKTGHTRSRRDRLNFTHKFDELVSLLNSESDRGCVIVGVGMLDDALAMVLMSFLATRYIGNNDPSESKEALVKQRSDCFDRLLGRDGGPLTTMSSRTLACLALGLIDELTRKRLDWMRQIRNDAAHVPELFSLDNLNLEKIWGGLNSGVQRSLAMLEGLRRFLPDTARGTAFEKPNRRVFEVVCAATYGTLLAIALDPLSAAKILDVDSDKEPADALTSAIGRIRSKKSERPADNESS